MGTDIHLQVEVFRDGKWQCCPESPFPGYRDPGFSWDNNPTNRNYNLFAFLAGVRNGFGFAGVPTGTPVKPYFADRGLPDDYAFRKEEFKNPYGDEEEDDEWAANDEDMVSIDAGGVSKDLPSAPVYVGGDTWIGDHSFTHATLTELLSCDWDRTFHHLGVVSVSEYIGFKRDGHPWSWCGDVGGGGVVVYQDPYMFEQSVLLKLKANGIAVQTFDEVGALESIPNLDMYVRVEWDSQPLAKCAFRRWLLGDDMQAIAAKYGGPDNVRVIMGFDS